MACRTDGGDAAVMRQPWLEHLDELLDAELVTGSPASPFRPAVLRWAAANGRPADPHPLLDALEANRVGGHGGSRRYRWSFPVARWMPLEERIRWRPLEAEAAERNPGEHAGRLWTPIVLVEHIDWLEKLSHGADPDAAAQAARILVECSPILEDDVARHFLGADAWADTFMLWTFARRPRALTRVRGLVTAVAVRYAARAARSGGVVLGRSFPFFETPLPSATAHLASAAARIGDGIEVVTPAIEWLLANRRRDGGWGDPGQESDILTTLAVAEMMGNLDPRFDPADVLDALGSQVGRRGGRPELIGPEWSWVAAELLAFAGWAARPFRERFRWPHVPDWMIDERVRVPRYEAYLEDARLFEGIPGLASAPLEIAFIDMAGFGSWNTAHGQAAGDELLACLTQQLRTVSESRTIRDGGDEFLVLGAPEASGLEERLRDLFARWVDASHEFRADLPVVPLRGAVMTARADGLRDARENLGKWIGVLKADFPEPPPEGVVRRFPEYVADRR
jgi:GGDEF domain-containing protein